MLHKSDGRSLRAGFLSSVSSFPDAPAFNVRGNIKTYSELDRIARNWAACLMDICGGRPERIGIFANRSEISCIGTVASLMAGATFVPLNPTFPCEKTAAMIARADLDVIIVDHSCAAKIPEIAGITQLPALIFPEQDAATLDLDLPVITRTDLQRFTPLSELPPLTPDDTAYLLFTSGSTGVPKGVPVTHGNAVHFIEVMSKRYQIRPEDRLSQTFDQTFDLSVFDLFMAWFNGACLYTISPIELLSPVDFINRNRLTIWFSVPSVAIQMVKRRTLRPNSLPDLRLSLFCGEPLESRIAQAWQTAAPGSVLENLYGPTELTIACFAYTWDSQRTPAVCKNDYVPIGFPLAGLSACILDEDSLSMMEGGPGELAVSGPQTTLGYWNDTVQTSAKFVELPISRQESRRFYRTGDRVMRLSDGAYAFLGRTDQQIKVLGHRVELGEVESLLRRLPGVEYAVAMGWPPSTLNAESIVAVVSGTDQLDLEEMRHAASAALPLYMVPRAISRRSSMPLNANGKIDRQRLKQELEQASQETLA